MGTLGGGFCERLPMALIDCPVCGGDHIATHSRTFRWIIPSALFGPEVEPACDLAVEGHPHMICPMCNPPEGRHGLLWVGHANYTTQTFLEESRNHGVSKRLAAVPRGLVFGETVVYLVHIKACGTIFDAEGMKPGIFAVFKPTHIDLVIDDPGNIPDRAKNIAEKLGDRARLVKVNPI